MKIPNDVTTSFQTLTRPQAAAVRMNPVDDASADHYITRDPEAVSPPDPWRRGFTRRRLLQGGAAVGCAALGSQLLTSKYAFGAADTTTADTLVVLSFRGGIDGLSVVIPRDAELRDFRPNVGVAESATQRLDERFGLHPALAPLKPFYDIGQLGFVHAAGSPQPDYSHFSAMDVFERGSIANSTTGWIDRVLTERSKSVDPSTFAGVAVGNSLPRSMAGPSRDIAFPSIDEFYLRGDSDGRLGGVIEKLYNPLEHPATTQVTSTLGAFATAQTLAAAGYQAANGATYPESGLGNTLKEVARLIKADIGLQIATCDIGGWDMHTDMGSVDSGDMTGHLTEVGLALAAFATDLGDEWLARTTLATLSEFGRRVQQNDSGGTDHGHGNVMFLLGGGINGGQVYGAWPGLAEAQLADGNLQVTTDYRDVIGEWLLRRGGIGSLAPIFPDLTHTPLGFTKGR